MFDAALAFVLRAEGGYSDHPADPGGATNRGITQATYDAWRRAKKLPPRPVREITGEEVKAIYRERYWNPIRGDDLPPALALAAFDTAVNMGVAAAREGLKVANGDWRLLIAWRIRRYTSLRKRAGPGQRTLWETFGAGWMNRLADLLAECARLDPLQPPLSQARRLILLDTGQRPMRIERASLVGDKLYIRLEKEEE